MADIHHLHEQLSNLGASAATYIIDYDVETGYRFRAAFFDPDGRRQLKNSLGIHDPAPIKNPPIPEVIAKNPMEGGGDHVVHSQHSQRE
jgi:hypothetical protein